MLRDKRLMYGLFVGIVCLSLPLSVSADTESTRLTASFKTILEHLLDRMSPLLNKQIPEITAILRSTSLEERVGIYRDLIRRLGPEEAQKALQESGLPFNGETHLLNHTVGDYLYEIRGASGILECKDYFLSSCYHGLILNAISDNGFSVFEEIMTACTQAGKTVLPQCAHGIGHGLLAWYGYKNLPEAARACQVLGEKDFGFPTFNCYDGVFMENQWAVHEGKPSPDRWVSEEDPYYPCTDPLIEEPWKKGCWANQGSALFHRFEGNIKKVTEYCGGAAAYRETCLDSLARQIHPSSQGNVATIFRMCSETGDWKNTCLTTVASAEYSVGGRELPFEICKKIDGDERRYCIERLTQLTTVYSKNATEASLYCKKVSPLYYNSCSKKIGL